MTFSITDGSLSPVPPSSHQSPQSPSSGEIQIAPLLDEDLLTSLHRRMAPLTRNAWIKVVCEYNKTRDSRYPEQDLDTVIDHFVIPRRYLTFTGLMQDAKTPEPKAPRSNIKKRNTPIQPHEDDPANTSVKRAKRYNTGGRASTSMLHSPFSQQDQHATTMTSPAHELQSSPTRNDLNKPKVFSDRITTIKSLKKRLQRAEGRIEILEGRNEKLHERNEKLHEKVERLQSTIQHMQENGLVEELEGDNGYEDGLNVEDLAVDKHFM